MATISFCCGGDATSEPGTTSHWTASTGTITADATHVRTGSYALKFAASGSATYLSKTLAASNRHVVLRFGVYVTSAASALRLLEWNAGGWTNFYLDTDGKLWISTGGATGVTLPLNEFVIIDFHIDTSANPHAYSWKVNGTADSATRALAAADVATLFVGDSNVPNTSWWIDDLALSYVSGDYPIPAGTVTGTSPEVWTPDPVVPAWTTPADTAAMSTTPELKFNSPTSAVAQHFYLELDTANTFNTGNLRQYDSSANQTGWDYWNGSTWTALPSSGLSSTYAGNEIRFTVSSALSSGTWYRRVRAGTLG